MKRMKMTVCRGWLLAVLFLLTFSCPAWGQDVQDVLTDAESMDMVAAPTTDISGTLELDASARVMDAAGLLKPEEAAALEERADTLSEQYQCDTLIVTVPDTQGYSVSRFAEQLHQAYSLGYGEEQSCVMLLLAAAERDYDLMAYGYGNTVCTDWGKSVMEEKFLPFFANDDYYGGFCSYLDSCEQFLQMAQDDTPFDVNTDPEKTRKMKLYGFFGSLILAWMAAKGITAHLKYQMKNAREKTEAGEYIAADGLHLTVKRDQFLRAAKDRRYAPPPKKQGGTTVNRGGYSHHSGKY